MFILSSISGSLEFWSVNNTSIYENSELKVFKNFLPKCFGQLFNNWANDLLGKKHTKLLNLADNCYNELILLQ